MSLFSDIEKTIDRGFRSWTEKMFGKSESDDLLMLHHAVLEEVEGKLQTGLRGARLLPYNAITVEFASAAADRRALLQAAFGEGRLEKDIREALHGAGCEAPRNFTVDIVTMEAGAPVRVSFAQRKAALKPEVVQQTALLEVVHGDAAPARYELKHGRVNLGRLAEVVDSRQRVARRNNIAFADEGEINATVSRGHANIRYDAATAAWYLRDEGSEHGTGIFREGRRIDVPAANRLGERLRDGDEIYLGRACLLFRSTPS